MPRRLADRYVLGDQLGVGGSSRVHVALDTRLGRKVAVKLLNSGAVASADPAGRERFLREGTTTAAFSHRHAVTVFDAGEDGGDLFLVMELVDGPSLAEQLARSGPLAVGEAVRVATQVLSVLATAHAAGIVHRDVKPANILIRRDGETKLADFGIAKRFDELDASVTSTGMVVGTPRYLAPEQAVGAPATPASDVYSVGVVLFEMLTGRLPFEAETSVAAALAQQSNPAPDVRTVRPDVPPALAAVIARTLATRPGDRPTAAELLASLDAAGSTAADSPVRSTRLMPVATTTDQSHAPTRVLPAQASPDGPDGRQGSTGPTAVLVFSVLLLLLGVGVVASIRSGDDGAQLGTDETVVSVATAPAGTAPVTAAATQPPTTPQPATTPPVTEPTTTTSTSTSTSTSTTTSTTTSQPPVTQPAVEEIIPGFPATDDIEVFLAQIEEDPEALGDWGPELAEYLRTVVDARGRDQRQHAADLREALDEFVQNGGIPIEIAEALDPLLAELAGRDSGGDDDDD